MERWKVAARSRGSCECACARVCAYRLAGTRKKGRRREQTGRDGRDGRRLAVVSNSNRRATRRTARRTNEKAPRRRWTRGISNSNSNSRARTNFATNGITSHRIPEQSGRGATRWLNHLLSVLACSRSPPSFLSPSTSVSLALAHFARRGAANGTAVSRGKPCARVRRRIRFPTPPARYRMRKLSHLPVSCSSRTAIAMQVERPRRAAIVT